ncbi:hypothetical protein T01_1893 [Trichinella spiralis]|uniref:Uncharacterized protein n=1 Tax=Trichinella spiralis TaxID=6334 RepID=A0A0V0YT24_TRISP|nr:hypothetical protein T01_1893 [Trichinella spiralis]
MATINPPTGSVVAVTVIPKQVWDKATSGRKLHGAARPMQLGDGDLRLGV